MKPELKKEDTEKYIAQEKELREQLRKLRFDNALGQLDDTSKIKKARRELARVLTYLKQIKSLA